MRVKGAERKWLVIRSGLLVILLVLVVGVGEFVCEYTGRFQTIRTIEKVTDYEEYNLYRMEVCASSVPNI